MSKAIQNCSYEEIGTALRKSGRIAIAAHIRPDGDAIGSSLALGSSLREAGLDVVVLNEDGVPPSYTFLKESSMIQRSSDVAGLEVDMAVALDTANQSRLGDMTISILKTARIWANIDHHISNERYGDLIRVEDSEPATGQIVYEFLQTQGLPITEAARDAIYVAISTDTGSFQYPSTNARSYEIGADLIKAGADVGQLSSLTYNNFPKRRIDALRELLNVMRLDSEERVASWALTMDTKARLALRPDDTENLIDCLRGIAGVVVAVFFEELKDGTIRVSMRSKSPKANVCEICQHFGGGGHMLAAGARIDGKLKTVQADVLSKIQEVLETTR